METAWNGSAVLVVDDDPGIVEVIRHILEWRGMAVLTARSLEEAQRVESGHPGEIPVLLTDIVMPGGSGQAVAEHMRSRRPGIRVVFMSGMASAQVLQAGDLREGDTFMPKPFNVKSILAHVEDCASDGPDAPSGLSKYKAARTQ